VRPRWIVAVALLGATLTACSTTHVVSIGSGPGGTGPSAALVASANLQPCPTSAAPTVSGGLPDVTLPCLGKGPAVNMAGLAGKPTVVNIWGSWCVPCQAEAGYLSAAYDKSRDKVRFIGVDTQDEADSALDFGSHVSPPVRYPSVFDEDKKVILALHYTGPPETVFVDSAGRIVHIHLGKYDSTAAVRADIATYLHVTA
jgi:cytochrome c biogenesis protein CcmG, thiol:disulfide interchange protein DsbE